MKVFRILFKVALATTFAFTLSNAMANELKSNSKNLNKLSAVKVLRNDKGVYIDLSLENNVSSTHFKPEFERNFIQIVMNGVKMNASKIQNVQDSEVQKVFAYPYSQDISRLRVLLKGDHSWAKGRVSVWNLNTKTIRVFVKDPVGISAVKKKEIETQQIVSKKEKDQELVKEILQNTKEIDLADPKSIKNAVEAANAASVGQNFSSNKEEIGIKTEPSKHFGKLALALLTISMLLAGVVFFLKKYSSKLNKLPFGKKERLIQVVATHHLGHKRSISLVKIAGEYLVIGVGHEGINLISRLGAEVNVDKYLEDRFWGGTFEKHLDSFAKDVNVQKEIDLSDQSKTQTIQPQTQTVQPKIRSSFINQVREKTSSLKPLV